MTSPEHHYSSPLEEEKRRDEPLPRMDGVEEEGEVFLSEEVSAFRHGELDPSLLVLPLAPPPSPCDDVLSPSSSIRRETSMHSMHWKSFPLRLFPRLGAEEEEKMTCETTKEEIAMKKEEKTRKDDEESSS